jgi:ADP-heptose:LPS heptosyltransferase
VNAPISGAKRIAVVRANAIGDFVLTLPALGALRQAYPSAEITLVGRRHHRELLDGRPSPVDRVEVAPPYGGVTADEGEPQGGPELDEFFARMQARRFDLAVQLHGGGANSNPFVHRLGARVTAGLRDRGAPPLDRWIRYTYPHHEVLRHIEAVSLVGAGTPPSLEPALTVTSADRREAAAVLPPDPGAPAAPLAVLNAGATDRRRRWPVARFAVVGRALRTRGLEVVVSGDAGDAELATAVVAGVGPGARSIAGSVTLGGLLGVLERAAVVVSNDTGPLHLARAVGTPTVGIYWCVNALNFGPTATHRHRQLVSWQAGGPGGGLVDDVPAAAVVDEVADVLAVTGAGPDAGPDTSPDATPPTTPRPASIGPWISAISSPSPTTPPSPSRPTSARSPSSSTVPSPGCGSTAPTN